MNEFANIPSGVGAAAIMFGKKIEVPQTQTPQTPTEPAKTEVKTEHRQPIPTLSKPLSVTSKKKLKQKNPMWTFLISLKKKHHWSLKTTKN